MTSKLEKSSHHRKTVRPWKFFDGEAARWTNTFYDNWLNTALRTILSFHGLDGASLPNAIDPITGLLKPPDINDPIHFWPHNVNMSTSPAMCDRDGGKDTFIDFCYFIQVQPRPPDPSYDIIGMGEEQICNEILNFINQLIQGP